MAVTGGKVIDNSVGTGATATADVDVSGAEELVVVAMTLAAGASGDVSLEVMPMMDEGPSWLDAALPAFLTTAPALRSSNAVTVQVHKVAGLDKVRIGVKNNNAGTKTVRAYVAARESRT